MGSEYAEAEAQEHEKRVAAPLSAPAPPAQGSSARTLSVGPAWDPAEIHADRLADAAMQAISNGDDSTRVHRAGTRPPQTSQPAAARVQRAAAVDAMGAADGEPDQATSSRIERAGTRPPQTSPPVAARVQRAAAADAIGAAGGELDQATSRRIERASGGGRPMEPETRSKMEFGLGANLSGVRIHTDANADVLNRQLSARAFTVGRDVFFSGGAYRPSTPNGQHLIAHELAHVVQQGGRGFAPAHASRRTTTIRRRFKPARVVSEAHLRINGRWDQHHGDAIPRGQELLANTAAPVTQNKTFGNETWIPAVNVAPDHRAAVPGNRRGYIRSSRVEPTGDDLRLDLRVRVSELLAAAEARYPGVMDNKLNKSKHVNFLMDKAIQYPIWNAPAAKPDLFSAGLEAINGRLERIRVGANYVADSIYHWRRWLHEDHPDRVTVDDVNFMGSDLHEEGLGVVNVRFGKPANEGAAKFRAQTTVNTMLKPENKDLEQRILGDGPDSAASRINQIVGLDNPDEMLQTIKMQCDEDHGTLVEVVKGIEAGKMAGHAAGGGTYPVKGAFHETLVFAFLAGIDDLHHENVYWHNGRPFLIDADNVLSHNQMVKFGNGDIDQKGFTAFNAAQAGVNRSAIKAGTNPMNSEIMDAMLNDFWKRVDIGRVLRRAISTAKGRVVPVKSQQWGAQLDYWVTQAERREANLDISSADYFMVGKEGRFESAIGPGLLGVVGENDAGGKYKQDVEKAEQRRDFTNGVIPFYEFEFDSGVVRHNGEEIYNGLTVDQAIGAMLDRFDPSGRSRAAAGM